MPEHGDVHSLHNIVTSHGYHFLNDEMTTRETSTSASCLDHFMSNFNLPAPPTSLKTSITDHYAVLQAFDIGTFKNTREKITIRPDKKLNDTDHCNSFRFYTNHKLQSSMTANTDINTKCEDFISIIKESIDRFFPETEINIKTNFKPWITSTIKNLLTKKDKLYQKWMNDKTNEETKLKYTSIRNKITAALKKSKKDYYKKKIEDDIENRKGSVHKLFKEITNKHIKQTHPAGNSQEIGNGMNEFFANIGEKLARNIAMPTKTFSTISYPHSMFFNPVTTEEVIRIIENLKNSKACGPDGINTAYLKCLKTNNCTVLE